MNGRYFISVIIIMILLIPNITNAGNQSSYTITLQQTQTDDSEHKHHLDPEGRRSAPVPILCNISQDEGLLINGFSSEITEYEILDPSSETVIASLNEESDFIQFLFSQTGDIKIIFKTEDYYLVGYITIN